MRLWFRPALWSIGLSVPVVVALSERRLLAGVGDESRPDPGVQQLKQLSLDDLGKVSTSPIAP
jgi:hypothetical protein